ncbi:MAG TPA: M56 family metallopeptidase [Terriglobales bacterium]|nr:M56 family metallopeptidase [Terriglobales bacterium]
MTAAFNLNELARMSAASLLNCMLEGVGIALFAWVLLRLVGRRNSSTRFAVWFFALLAIAALPVLGVAASSARLTSAGSAGSAITVPSSWALDIFFVWGAIAGVSLLRVGVGLWQLRKLRRSCSVINVATLDPMLRATLQAFQSVRSVGLCQSDHLRVPTAIGFLKPVVVIPTWALHELSTAELNSILIHELAHLRRHDDWTNLAQQILKALLFFHPAVWWIQSQLALEREMACDDAVLAETTNPRGYAQCLISVAEKSFMRRGLALAQAAVNRMRQTSLRVSRILDANRSSATHVWKPALYSVAAFFVVCLVAIPHAPELVAFEDVTPGGVLASGAPAHAMLASAPVATMASFREDSQGLVDHRAKPVATPHQPRSGSRMQPTAQVVNAMWKTAESQRSERTPTQKSDRPARLLQPNGEDFVPAVLMTINRQAAPQAIFVVMQAAQYEAGPMFWRVYIWHVTVVDSNPAETRIPTKQI